MRKINLAPSLFTLGNLWCGFGALAVIAHAPGDNWDRELVVASFFILGAMLFDMLDGKVARLTGQMSDFGGQLDSLGDMVAFGAAPGLIVYIVVYRVFHLPATYAMLLGGAYVAATALRLARFNVANAHDEGSHHFFLGLPSPAAAGVVSTLVIVDHHLVEVHRFMGLARNPSSLALEVLPYAALLAAMLMVSSIPYVHVTNLLLKRRRPPELIVIALVFLVFLILKPETTLFCVFGGYLLSGPMASARRILTRSAEDDLALGPAPEDGEEDEDDKEALI
ncbi:MAG: CDP-alcohol phosphatidyltransferase family protein [Planctomycetes bacterium]|nr:CDP-alcohol phosphatidyltransferase family protein [Planctomycetota bacterium]